MTAPEKHRDFLIEYSEGFKTGKSKNDTFIGLKQAHSLRVHENSLNIIEGEEIYGPKADLCELASIYHDIGRFPQFARFGTFNDRVSANHARLGVLTLREQDMPGDLSSADWQTIRVAVGQHNVKELRPSLPDRYLTPTQVVRDADKLDILKVMVDHFSGDNPDPVMTHGFEDVPGKYTKSIYESVMAEESGDYSLIRYANDFKLIIIGWIYGLYYKTSIQLLAERGHVQKLLSFLPKDENIERLEEKIHTFIRYNTNPPS